MTDDLSAQPSAPLPTALTETLLRSVLDRIPVCVGVLALDGVLLHANLSLCEAAGGSEAATLGKKLWELGWWGDAPQSQARLRQALARAAAGETQRYAAAVGPGDDTARWLDLEIAPLRDASGRVTHLCLSATDITERRQAEESLRHRAEELERLLEAVPAAVWVASDPHCLAITGNRRANELYEAAAGDNVSATTVPEARRFYSREGQELGAEALPMQVASATNRDVRDAELWVSQSSGARRALLGNAVPLRNARGEVRGCIGAFIDVTERRLAEERLRESEQRYRVLTEVSPQIVWMSDSQGACTYLNQWWLDYSGMTMEQSLGQGWSQAIDPQHREPIRQNWLSAAAQGGAWSGEIPFRRASDGQYRWHLSRAVPLRDAGGAIVRWMGTAVDIHDRKLAERELAESRARLADFAAATFEGIVFSEGGRIVDCNPQLERMLDYPPGSLAGREIEDLIHPQDRARALAGIRQGRESHMEHRLLRRDGSVVFVEVRGLPGGTAPWSPRRTVIRDVTERTLAELSVRESDARLRQAAEAARFGVFEVDLEAGKGYWSPEMQAILGLCADGAPLPHRTVPDFVHPDDVGQVQTMIDRIVDPAGDGRIQDTHRIVRPDGGMRWVMLKGQAEYRGAGAERRAVRVRGVLLDVTEQHAAQERLRLSEERFRLALRNAPVSVAIQDRDLRYVWAYNQRTARPQEIVGHTDADIFTPEEAAHFEAVKRRVLAEGVEINEQMWLERPGGRIYLDVYWEPVRDAQGRVTGVGSATVNLTRQKRAEEALRAAHDTFYHLVQHSPFGVYAVDADFRVAQVSAGAQRVFENVRPLLGRDLAEVLRAIWTEPFASEAIARFRHTLKTGETYRAPSTVERRQDSGALESYDWKIERVVLPDGRPGVVCHFYDLSERQRYEEALREADRRKDELLATLAHELRNPLAPIRTGLDLLRLAEDDPAATAPVIEMMRRQLDHLVRLVDDLLDVARIDRGKIALRKELVDLRDAAGAAIEGAAPGSADGGRRLWAQLPDEPLIVEGDPVRLAQVIGNLLGNAVKFTGENGQIWLALARHPGPNGDRARISVRDDGEGIAPELLDRVFEMFTQASPSRGGGLGIGLALVRALATLHGGSVEARSAGPGLGSELIVDLPLAPAGGQRPGPRGAPVDGRIAARRILVVDDNRDIADSFGMLLKTLGADVHVVYDGPAALAAFAARRPEVVLLDIGMPAMDGYEVARRLRAQCPDRDLVLVAVTGWGDAQDRRRVLAAGFDHHLVKPPSLEALRAVLGDRPDSGTGAGLGPGCGGRPG